MNRSPWLAVTLLSLLSGCSAEPTGIDARRYACDQDSECATDFVCLAGVCQRLGTTGRGDGGPDDGSGPVPVKLGFVTPAQTVTAGQCSQAVTVETQTAAGGAAVVASAVTVTLSAQSGSGAMFYQDAECTSGTPATAVAAGASRATFYFRNTTAQGVTVTAAATGLTSVQQSETVRAAVPGNIVFISSAQTLNVGACSSKVEVELRDAYANPASFSGQIDQTPSGTGLIFFSDATCNTSITKTVIAPEATRTFFYFRSRQVGTAQLTVSVPYMNSVTQEQSIQPR